MTRSANYLFQAPLIFILLFGPMFLGGHRPFFWALWASVALLVLLIYVFLLARAKVYFVSPDKSLFVIGFLFFSFLLGVLAQLSPVDLYLEPVVFRARTGYEIISNTLSLTPGDSFLGLLRWITYGILFFITLQINYRNEERARTLLRSVIIIIALYAVYSVLALYRFGDTILTLDKWAYKGFATGTFVNRNSFATFLGLGAIVSMCFLLEKPKDRDVPSNFAVSVKNFSDGRKPILIMCFLSTCLALSMTGSRMGIFATGIALLVVIGLQLRRKHFVTLLILLAAIGVPIIFFIIAGTEETFDRVFSTDQAFDVRIGLYSDIIEMIMARPWFGYGLGSFEYAFPLFHSELVPTDLIWQLAHSTYLGNWVDMGILFGTIPVAIFFIIMIRLIMALRSGNTSVEVYSALGCLTLVGLHALVDFSMEIHAVAMYMVIILGLSYAAIVRSKS